MGKEQVYGTPRIPEELRETLEGKAIITIYFGGVFPYAHNPEVQNFSKQHPSFDTVEELEQALIEYDKTAGIRRANEEDLRYVMIDIQKDGGWEWIPLKFELMEKEASAA